MTQPSIKPSFAALFGLLCGVFLGGGLTALGVATAYNELRLRGGGTVAEAEVLQTRVMSSRKLGKSYELRYRFTVPGSEEFIHHSDETGRDDLWASVETEEDWVEARSSGKVPVSYLPENPQVNRPLKAGAAPLGDPLAGMVLGLLIGLPCLLGFIVLLRKRWRQRAAVPTPA